MIPLNALTVLWAALVPLAQDVPDPDDVKPGWVGGTVVALLILAVVFLVFSLRKQLRRVDFEEPEDEDDTTDTGGGTRENGTDGGPDRGPGSPRTP